MLVVIVTGVMYHGLIIGVDTNSARRPLPPTLLTLSTLLNRNLLSIQTIGNITSCSNPSNLN